MTEKETKKAAAPEEKEPVKAPAPEEVPETETVTEETKAPPPSSAPAASEKAQAPGETQEEPSLPPGPAWEQELDVYPLREKTEDPRWAVRTVWIWVVVALMSLVFILTLLVLGIFYD